MKLDNFLKASPVFWVYIGHQEIFKKFQSQLNHEKLTFIQALILVGIFSEDTEVNATKLAKSLQVSPSVISHAIKELISQGLLTRKQLENDARKNYFKVTSSGRRKVEKLVKLFDSFQDYLESRLGERKLSNWNNSAQQLIEASKQYLS